MNSIDKRLEKLRAKLDTQIETNNNKPKNLKKLSSREIIDARKKFTNTACMICATAFHLTKKGKIVDHCHVTGVIRGIICHHCNVGLGMFKDDIDLLKSAIRYLEAYKYNPDLIED